MAHRQIVEKLKRELLEPFTTERQVVYVLAEIRKLLELRQEINKYRPLYFYCCWVLHTRLTRSGARDVLALFDEAHPLLVDDKELPRELDKGLNDVLTMRVFRRQLREFLEANGFATDVVRSGWTSFLRQYAAVIHDCPLTIAAPRTDVPSPRRGTPKNVARVSLHVEDGVKTTTGADGTEYKWYRLSWTSYDYAEQSGSLDAYFTIP